jgi:tetratricopeptide (TPR) repeat protein
VYYPGLLIAYLLASVLAPLLGIPYPLALILIALTWLARDRLDLPSIRRLFAGFSALGDARRQVAVNPADAEARFHLGSLLVERGRHAEALPHLEAALARLGKSAEAHHLLGRALLGAGRPAEAEASLRRALDLDPRFRQGDAHLALAEALQATSRPAEARDLLRGFFGDDTTSVEALTRMGLAAGAAGDHDGARRALVAAKAAYRGNPAFRRRRDRVWVIRARRGLGETVLADRLVLGLIVVAGILWYLWRLLG